LQKTNKHQNIIGLVIGLIIFFIIFLWGGYDTSRFFYPDGSIMDVIATNTSNFIFNTSSWGNNIWFMSTFIYFYFNWKYRSCIGYYAIKLSLSFYKKI
jgi:hypothetical protein